MLQNFLYSAGYLPAAPNGNFGPATLAAVKRFQATYGISAVGSVGPLTRAALKLKTCTNIAQTTPTSPSTPASNQSASAIAVTSPGTGETLRLGSQYTIKFTAQASGPYNLVLEDATGTRFGYILPGTYNKEYVWTVGNVIDASQPSGQTVVPPGTYRVHAESTSGQQATDKLSGVFTISSDLVLSDFAPRSAAIGVGQSVAAFGSGFNSSSMISLYGYGTVPALYVSPDGTILIFEVPAATYPGARMISVINRYGSSDTSVESNQSSITLVR
jgi:peptidoglycan hydrolase-like protein with peptidoglycan-binding domain